MPSKEDICVLQDSLTDNFASTDVEELVAAIKHNLHLKSKSSHGAYAKHRRISPYAAPVRSVCRKSNSLNSLDTGDHSPTNCKYCLLRSSNSSQNNSQDPYEILVLLREGILINEAVKRLQMDSQKCKNKDYYELEDGECI